MKNLPELGIGIVYFTGFEELLERHSELIHAIEIEPQTLWYESNNRNKYNFNTLQNKLLNSYQIPKVFHGVGSPVGGTALPSQKTFSSLRQHIKELKPLWFSEHLSFNSFNDNSNNVNTNFLLPQVQNKMGIETAVRGIKNYKEKIDLPFAFETGVNYMKPRRDEIPDGNFAAEISERADCNILLDLHNLLVNQKNGRQSAMEFCKQLPLDRVIELHLARGFYFKKYYLDAHSGISSKELFDLTCEVVQMLPNLKLIMFEMRTEYITKLSKNDYKFQLDEMQRVWESRGKKIRDGKTGKRSFKKYPVNNIGIKDWEYTVGKLVLNRDLKLSKLSEEISSDKGIKIISEIIFNFRASSVVSTLKMSSRLMRMTLGEKKFRKILEDFFIAADPELFPFKTALKFSAYVKKLHLDILYLDKILEFEVSALKTLHDSKERKVRFFYNPFPVFRELINKKLPERQEFSSNYLLAIKPDEMVTDSEFLKLKSIFHD